MKILDYISIPIYKSSVPDIWNSIIVSHQGRPQHVAIQILSNIVAYYNDVGKDKHHSKEAFYFRYSDLVKRHNVCRDTIRKSFVRLEELGLANRLYKHIESKETFCYNALFVEFNFVRLEQMCEDHKRPSQASLSDNFISRTASISNANTKWTQTSLSF